jgi:predicted GNAT family N-acyltransferase
MPDLDIHITADKKEIDAVMKIREIVFILGQKVDWEIEMDGLDKDAIHVIALLDGKPAGCARLRFLDQKAKFERIAVLPEYRKQGIGKKIMEFLVDYSKKKGAREAYMNAQVYASDFYVKCGFMPRGPEFMEAGMMHQEMFKKL